MQSKPFWKSKSIWTAVASLIVAIVTALGLEIDPKTITTVLFAILGLLGINLRLAQD